MNRVLTIYSAEEAIGKSTLAINLGASLIQETQKSVIFLELCGDDEGVPAWSLLKLPPPELLSSQHLADGALKSSIRRHSSQLALLTLAPDILRDAVLGDKDVLQTILSELLEEFDYVIVELSLRDSALSFEVLDKTDVLILMASSFEYEQPISSIGHSNFRLVVNRYAAEASNGAAGQLRHYLLPEDSITVDNFRKSGIPFVIQAPYRPISQTIGRLARELGERQFGIALSGGAALSLTQLGILEVLERNQIAIDMIAGVSFGALIGASLAAGLEFRRIKEAVMTWAESCRIVAPWSWRRWLSPRFFADSGLDELCRSLLDKVYFDDLKLPLNVMAVDTRTASSVVFKEGRVLDAVRSCMRIPDVFVPFPQTEAHLIDSSVIYPMPVLPLKRMGANICAAVTVTPTPAESHQYFQQKQTGLQGSRQRAMRENYTLVTATFDSLMARLTDSPDKVASEAQLQPDILISPNCQGISWKDFHQAQRLFELGSQAAEEMIPRLETLRWG